jgi:hypothetical protein
VRELPVQRVAEETGRLVVRVGLICGSLAVALPAAEQAMVVELERAPATDGVLDSVRAAELDLDLDQALELFRASGRGPALGQATEQAAETGPDSEVWMVLEPETAPDRAVGVVRDSARAQAVEVVPDSAQVQAVEVGQDSARVQAVEVVQDSARARAAEPARDSEREVDSGQGLVHEAEKVLERTRPEANLPPWAGGGRRRHY